MSPYQPRSRIQQAKVIWTKPVNVEEQKHLDDDESFENSMKWPIIIAQLWMVFPKPGLLHRSSTSNSRFTYFSLLTILNLAIIASTVVESLFYLYNWTVAGFGINKSFMMVFIITTIFVCGDLHRLARSWPTLSKSWFNQDLTLRSKFNQRPRINRKKYFLQLTVLTFVGQVVLSALYIWWGYDNTLDNMTFCQYPQNYSVLELWHRRERSHIFSYIKFQTWMSPLLQLQFFVTDLGWIFSQNLVIFCSIWITTRFQQLYDQVQEEIRTGSNLKWKEIHNHFNQLVDLVNDVDRELGNSVILTCSTRLFLICYDLFKSTRADEGIDVCTYTFYRLLFYGFMIVLFIWKASDIPVIAEKIKTSLLRKPELKDFQGQIAYTTVALTGNGMFSLTRKTLLTFIGTIVTYEVILSQSNYEGSSVHLCAYNVSQLS